MFSQTTRPLSARFGALWLLAIGVSACIKTGGSARRDGGPDASPVANARPQGEHGKDAGARVVSAVDAGPPPPPSAERGKVLYDRYCGFCHGAEGKGYAADEAPALANEELLSLASDEYLGRAIARGRPGTTMSAWHVQRGGPLADPDVASIVAHVRTWQSGKSSQQKPSSDASSATATAASDGGSTGDPKRGATVYAAKCASCHGAAGHDGKYIALANPELLASADDAFLTASIERGRPGTPMLPFAGKIPAQGIQDLVALIRSWQKPVDDVVVLPPKPGELGAVVLNPRGPEPGFDEKADFIPVDVVKRELDRGAKMVFADARAPSDYVKAHVAGAISVPFYQVEPYSKQIPKDVWILTYCACPHAVSVKSREAFRGLGYKHVAVLDEGVIVWRDRGYPTRGGAKP